MKLHLAISIVPFILLLVPTHQQGSWISNECGFRQVKTSGTANYHGQWPWHVAVYRATPTNRTMEYTCGGTLISDKFVLTAGQCLLDEKLQILSAHLFAVRLGVYDLERLGLRFGRFRRVMLTFVTHEIWENGSSIALLELSEGVQFGDYIQPICIYQGFLEDIRDGTMASWSLMGLQSDLLKSVELSVMPSSTCSESSQWHLCTGFSNGTVVNKAGIGGGFFVERDDLWYLIEVLIQLPQGQTYLGFQVLTQTIQWIKAITDISYLEEIISFKNSTDHLVSPSAPEYASRLTKQCGNFIPSRVHDDIHSEVYEFPWIALVGYRSLHYVYRPYFSCSGTLINRRYVLTSGACVSHGKINVVQLGEQEIGKDRDCDLIDENDCALVVQDFDVENFFKHHSHDIGLIRLAGSVVYEDHILPVCLPVTSELQNLRPALYFVTGWKETMLSDRYPSIMRKEKVRELGAKKCQKYYNNLTISVNIGNVHLCTKPDNFVPCEGHGGEPLGAAVLYNGYRFVQFGIRTQVNRCDPGAAIYLNVAYFVDWIMLSMEAKDFAEPKFENK